MEMIEDFNYKSYQDSTETKLSNSNSTYEYQINQNQSENQTNSISINEQQKSLNKSTAKEQLSQIGLQLQKQQEKLKNQSNLLIKSNNSLQSLNHEVSERKLTNITFLNHQQGIIENIDSEQLNNQNQQLYSNVAVLFNNNNMINDYTSSNCKICQQLQLKNYIIQSYLISGGQADIFEGYFLNNQGEKEDCIFKIYQNVSNQNFKEEIEIMKSFEKPINVVKIFESYQIDNFIILIIEKCQYSLKQELNEIKEKKIEFSIDKLLMITFNLLDGLIQFRIYHILHLDIKPDNILVSKQGKYCFSDFGASFNIKNKKEVKPKAQTKQYASIEQLNNENVDYQSDIYSLGKTLLEVIQIFKQENQDFRNKKENIVKLIKDYEQIINAKMIQNKSSDRDNCQDLHDQFLKQTKVDEYKQFFINYQNQIKQIIELYSFDKNKDIPYFMQLKLFYNLTDLYLIKSNENYRRFKNCGHTMLGYDEDFDLDMCLDIIKSLFKINFLDIIRTLNSVSKCYTDISDYQNGMKYQQESFEILKQLLPKSHPIIAQQYNILGFCYSNLGDFQNSFKCFKESLNIREKVFKGENDIVAGSLNNMGFIYLRLGDYQKSLLYNQKSLKMYQQIYKGNHESITIYLNNIGNICLQMDDGNKAIKYFLESLIMAKSIYQDHHPLIASTLNNIGNCYHFLGEYQKSLKYLNKSMQMKKQLFQENHHQFNVTLNNLGLCFRSLGDHKQSLNQFLETLKLQKLLLNQNHQEIALTLYNISISYSKLNDFQKSHQYALESLVVIKNFNKKHPDVASSLYNVGASYFDLKNYKKSEIYTFKSLQIKKEIYQDNQIEVFVSLQKMGDIYFYNQQEEKGLIYYLESLLMIKQIYKKCHHPLIKQSLSSVSQCYESLGRHKMALKYSQNS